MTMDFYTLCSRPLLSIDEWQGAVDELSFDLKLPKPFDIRTAEGAMTATWRGEPVVFEFSTFPFSELEETYSKVKFGRSQPHAYVMYTGSLGGCVGAVIAGVAIAHRTGGMFFDPQDGRVLKPDSAVRYAQQTEKQVLEYIRRQQH